MIISKHLITKLLPKLSSMDDASFINACNATGMEVEKIIRHPHIDNCVIGEIISIENHPNADRLHVVQVKINNEQTNTIVCGASNLKLNKKVIVALNNAKLHDGRTIEYKELRGVLSQGMICAYGELTPHSQFINNEDVAGIILLDEAIIGDHDVTKYIGLDDTIYDVSLPSNRNDLNGALFLCQELAGFFKLDYQIPPIIQVTGQVDASFKITYDRKLCNGFSVFRINNIDVKQSDWATKAMLMNNGIRPANVTLDKLAYVTLLTNIPTAVYDATKIGDEFSIGLLGGETSITTFGGKQYKLNPNDIVVKSNNNIISIAGVVGVSAFGLIDTTRDIVVEMGNFNYVNVRDTTISLDIKTDASRRCSKQICNYEIKLAQQLAFQEFNDFQKSTPINNLVEQPQISVPVDFKFINTFIGVNLTQDIIVENLKYYGFVFNGSQAIIPLNRLDIENTNDIAEEVCKFLNINEIKDEMISAQVGQTTGNTRYELIKSLKDILRSNHISEVKTYNLVDENNLQSFNVFKYSKFIKIENANNEKRVYLRSNLIQGLLSVYELNNSYKTPLQPIFEIQDIYTNEINTNLTILTETCVYLDRINKSQLVLNVNGLRAISNLIADMFNAQFEYFSINDNTLFYDNESLAIHCNGRVVGYVGALKNSKIKPFGLTNMHLYCLTLNLNMLLDLYAKPNMQFRPVDNLMPIYKDVSFIVKPGIAINNVLESFKQLTFINSYEFIDRYQLDDNKISYTIRFTFHNAPGLLTQTIDKYLQQIEQQLLENNCQIRK